MRKFSYIELGATLFIPATHKHLEDVILNLKYPNLKSVVIDCEDGIKDSELGKALQNIKELLLKYKQSELLVFIRPRDISTLNEILFYENILKIDGFILPKFSLQNAQQYIEILEAYNFYIMPSIEGEELFNSKKLNKLKKIIQKSSLNIELIRFGLEDIFKTLKMKRDYEVSPFDISVISAILGNFIATFKSSGFAISGGVYPFFNDKKGFKKELKRDLKEGLFSKTIIHPNQIDLANKAYKVKAKELDEALKILQSDDAVFNYNSKMQESKTMTPYAKEIVLRAEVYGVS